MLCNLFIGRFNPPTILHYQIIQEMVKNNTDCFVFIVSGEKSQKDKNPLDTEFIKKLISNKRIKTDICANAIQALDVLDVLGYNEVNLYCGSDRIKSYSGLNKYHSFNLNIKEIKRQNTDVSASMIRSGIRNNRMEVIDLLFPGISDLDIKKIIEKVNEYNPNNKKTSK